MEFLKEILGEELFNQVTEKINAHNGNEANKEKQVKLANLGGGEYVGKGKYDSEVERLTNLLNSVTSERDEANGLIADLKKGTKGNEELQGKINTYETQTIPDLQKQLQETKVKAALKVALLAEKALDIDYLTFKVNEKLKEQGKSLELDENENIKGWDELRDGLKTQFPKQFESAKGGGKVDAFKLPEQDQKDTMTRADFMRKPYAERAAFANENPEAYKEIMGH